jgi:hypothetical protein
MGKYEQLQRHLGQVDSNVRIRMTFEEVAQWVPGGLPSTAFHNPRWWANEPSSNHSQAQAWIQSGWAVSGVDLDNSSVTFERTLEAAQQEQAGHGGLLLADATASNGSGLLHLNGPSVPVIAPTNVRAMEQVAGFLGDGRVTGLLNDLAGELDGADADAADGTATNAGFTPKLLTEALALRGHFGRLNDLIHAAAMTMALPQLLEDDEVVAQRPWLAADRDPAHAFDLETDRRVADFNLAVWTGKDAPRKRALFQGLVHLTAQPSDRRRELYVAGEAPLRFLRSSRSSVAWALNRGPAATKSLYLERFSDLGMTIREFTEGPAAQVRLVNIGDVLPPANTGRSA